MGPKVTQSLTGQFNKMRWQEIAHCLPMIKLQANQLKGGSAEYKKLTLMGKIVYAIHKGLVYTFTDMSRMHLQSLCSYTEHVPTNLMKTRTRQINDPFLGIVPEWASSVTTRMERSGSPEESRGAHSSDTIPVVDLTEDDETVPALRDIPQIPIHKLFTDTYCEMCCVETKEEGGVEVHAKTMNHRAMLLLVRFGLWPGAKDFADVERLRPQVYQFHTERGSGGRKIRCLPCLSTKGRSGNGDGKSPIFKTATDLLIHQRKQDHIRFTEAQTKFKHTIPAIYLCETCDRLVGVNCTELWADHISGTNHAITMKRKRLEEERMKSLQERIDRHETNYQDNTSGVTDDRRLSASDFLSRLPVVPREQILSETRCFVCRVNFANDFDTSGRSGMTVHEQDMNHRIMMLFVRMGLWPGPPKYSPVEQITPKVFEFGKSSASFHCMVCSNFNKGGVRRNVTLHNADCKSGPYLTPVDLMIHQRRAQHITILEGLEAYKDVSIIYCCEICDRLISVNDEEPWNDHVKGDMHKEKAEMKRLQENPTPLPSLTISIDQLLKLDEVSKLTLEVGLQALLGTGAIDSPTAASQGFKIDASNHLRAVAERQKAYKLWQDTDREEQRGSIPPGSSVGVQQDYLKKQHLVVLALLKDQLDHIIKHGLEGFLLENARNIVEHLKKEATPVSSVPDASVRKLSSFLNSSTGNKALTDLLSLTTGGQASPANSSSALPNQLQLKLQSGVGAAPPAMSQSTAAPLLNNVDLSAVLKSLTSLQSQKPSLGIHMGLLQEIFVKREQTQATKKAVDSLVQQITKQKGAGTSEEQPTESATAHTSGAGGGDVDWDKSLDDVLKRAKWRAVEIGILDKWDGPRAPWLWDGERPRNKDYVMDIVDYYEELEEKCEKILIQQQINLLSDQQGKADLMGLELDQSGAGPSREVLERERSRSRSRSGGRRSHRRRDSRSTSSSLGRRGHARSHHRSRSDPRSWSSDSRSRSRSSDASCTEVEPVVSEAEAFDKLGWCNSPALIELRTQQLQKGYDSDIYKIYTTAVPKIIRPKLSDRHPGTPNKHINYSSRSWNLQMKLWQKSLYAWNGESPKGDWWYKADSRRRDGDGRQERHRSRGRYSATRSVSEHEDYFNQDPHPDLRPAVDPHYVSRRESRRSRHRDSSHGRSRRRDMAPVSSHVGGHVSGRESPSYRPGRGRTPDFDEDDYLALAAMMGGLTGIIESGCEDPRDLTNKFNSFEEEYMQRIERKRRRPDTASSERDSRERDRKHRRHSRSSSRNRDY